LRFLDSFAEAIHGIVAKPRRIVAWRDEHTLNRIELLRWVWPNQHQPRAPRIIRIGMNTHWFKPSQTLLRGLGFDPLWPPDYRECLRLEWSLLEHELLEFATWLPSWIAGRRDGALEIPVPPQPSHVFGAGLRGTCYAWTVAAWEVCARWDRQSGRLPWYAIHASQVVPAAPELQNPIE
jgi:hypothetical protein